MKKTTNQFLNKRILFILVFTILLTGCGKAPVSPTENTVTTEVTDTTEATPEETQPELAAPDAMPENVFSIEDPEDKRRSLQFLVMDLLEIPDQLGDSCYVKLSAGADKSRPHASRKAVSGGTQYGYEGLGTGYYVKDNVCYGQSAMHLTWNELADVNGEVKYLYNAFSRWKHENFYEVKTLTPEELYVQEGGDWVTISGTLNHEVYPAGENYASNLSAKRHLWEGKMMQVGLWYEKLSGECYGSISGDVYVMDSSDGYWICFDGMKPVKIPYVKQATVYEFTEPIVAVEGADFEKEKENALYRLSFDLLVEKIQDN